MGGARFSTPVQTGPGAHPASCTMGTGSFPGVKSGRGVTLTSHPLLVPWLRKGRAISLLPLWAVRPVQSLSACTRVHFSFFFSPLPAGNEGRQPLTCPLTIKTTNDKVNRTEIRTHSPATRLQPSVSVKHPGNARPGWILQTLELVEYGSRFAKVPKTDDSFGTSVRLHGKIQLPPDSFP